MSKIFFEHKWPTIALQIEIWGGEIWFFSVCTCTSEFFYNPRMTLKRGAIQKWILLLCLIFFFFSIENIFLRETLLFRLSCRKLKKWVMGTRNNNHQLFPSDEVNFGFFFWKNFMVFAIIFLEFGHRRIQKRVKMETITSKWFKENSKTDSRKRKNYSE